MNKMMKFNAIKNGFTIQNVKRMMVNVGKKMQNKKICPSFCIIKNQLIKMKSDEEVLQKFWPE